MKTLVLHVGIPKTGSSALQVFWARNAEALRQQSVDYFSMGDFALGQKGKISSGNGAHLARAMFPTESPIRIQDTDRIRKALEDAISASSCDTGLVSSELFIDVRPDVLHEFRGWLHERGITLKVLFYIRDQEQFLSSTYIQQVKRHGLTELPDEYVLRAYRQIRYLKYATQYQSYCEIVGAENVHCRNYDVAIRSQTGVFDAFLDAFSLKWDGLTVPPEPVNTSLQPKEIVIMLMLNSLKPRMTFSDLIVENGVRRGVVVSGAQHHILSQKTSEEITEYYQDENTRLARSYFGRDALFPERSRNADFTPVSELTLSVTDVVECLGGVVVRFDERLADLSQRLAQLERARET